jgi:isoamylase
MTRSTASARFAPGASPKATTKVTMPHPSPLATLASGPFPRIKLGPGRPYPLGASWDGSGTNFSVFSEVAERVELCLFDEHGNERRVDLPESTGYRWHGHVRDVKPGQHYGFRVHGPWDPARGLRCNPNKLLLDPYARAIEGEVEWDPAVFGYRTGEPDNLEETDSAPFVPRSIVVDTAFDWRGDRLLERAEQDMVIYEVHVKGFTERNPDVPEKLRGTYAGLAHPASLRHLQELGINAVELMPVHQFVQDGHLLERGLRNYWGYNSIGFFAPHNRYSSAEEPGDQVAEFKSMVRALHQAGIEVILDVVYNHTAEGSHEGPTLSFRGLDNRSYYRLVDGDERYYMDYTGTGNTLNARNSHVLQLIMDSLRYWVLEMHVDGFRFDLAAALARGLQEVDRLSAFFDLIQQDPVISQVKLIAEPWDVGAGGYQVGNFPPLWSEWNGKYRDTVRDFWRGEPGTLGEFGYRLTGSSDLYENTGRKPYASINFVTAHDGFTLRDLVSYNGKHNEDNGDDNRDGEPNNRSWNCGTEGPTEDAAVLALRARQERNFLATLLLSQGVPMILGGDEMGRTQLGNNNAYCQDSPLTWFDWEHVDRDLFDFTRRLVAFRADHPVFKRRGWFQGRSVHEGQVQDIEWYSAAGTEMTEPDWGRRLNRSIGMFLSGEDLDGEDGGQVRDESFYLAFNGSPNGTRFRLPESLRLRWRVVLDTAASPAWVRRKHVVEPGGRLVVHAHSLVVLRRA